MNRTVLFDLDGTLLPVELDFFLKHYMDALFKSFSDIMSREAFDCALLGATYDTIGNLDPNMTNLEVFGREFSRRTGLTWDKVWPKIQRYYLEEYPKLQRLIPPRPLAAEVVRKCIAAGWDLILATQPLFPEVAIRQRMEWCGVLDFPWRLVTTIEDMHFCKPHIEYYREILEMTGLDPRRCVMVGNDMQEDMVAGQLGLKTFLAEDFLLDRGRDLAPDMRGQLAEVPQALDKLIPGRD